MKMVVHVEKIRSAVAFDQGTGGTVNRECIFIPKAGRESAQMNRNNPE